MEAKAADCKLSHVKAVTNCVVWIGQRELLHTQCIGVSKADNKATAAPTKLSSISSASLMSCREDFWGNGWNNTVSVSLTSNPCRWAQVILISQLNIAYVCHTWRGGAKECGVSGRLEKQNGIT